MVPIVGKTPFEAPFLQNEAKFNLCSLKTLATQLWRYKPSRSTAPALPPVLINKTSS